MALQWLLQEQEDDVAWLASPSTTPDARCLRMDVVVREWPTLVAEFNRPPQTKATKCVPCPHLSAKQLHVDCLRSCLMPLQKLEGSVTEVPLSNIGRSSITMPSVIHSIARDKLNGMRSAEAS